MRRRPDFGLVSLPVPGGPGGQRTVIEAQVANRSGTLGRLRLVPLRSCLWEVSYPQAGDRSASDGECFTWNHSIGDVRTVWVEAAIHTLCATPVEKGRESPFHVKRCVRWLRYAPAYPQPWQRCDVVFHVKPQCLWITSVDNFGGASLPTDGDRHRRSLVSPERLNEACPIAEN